MIPLPTVWALCLKLQAGGEVCEVWGLHRVNACPNTDLKCANCCENHPASFRQCPVFKKETEKYVARNRATENRQPRTFAPVDPNRPAWSNIQGPTPSRNYKAEFPALPGTEPSSIRPTPQSAEENRACSLADVLKLFTNISSEQLQRLITLIQKVLENTQLMEIITSLTKAYGK